MGKHIDLTGQVFERLTVVRESERKQNKHIMWICICSCSPEVEREVLGYGLRYGSTKSCGCLRDEILAKNKKPFKPKHGMKGTRPYKIWGGMKERCLNPNSDSYSSYGGRGITVCDKWLTFEGFWEDMEIGYGKKLTLDRFPNNDGNYELSNCRWATREEQQRNKRDNHYVELLGKRIPLIEAVERFAAVSYDTVWKRLQSGWDIVEALARPNQNFPNKLW